MIRATLHKADRSPLAISQDRNDQLSELASIEPTGADFLSCYLDLHAGRAACQSFLETALANLRSATRGSVELDLDQAADMVRAALAAAWSKPSVPRAIAVFARGLAGGQNLTTIVLDHSVEPRLSFYPVPDLTQLVDQRQNDAFTLLLVRRGGLQILDVEGKQATSRAWSSLRVRPVVPSSTQASQSSRRFPVLRRALARHGNVPIVVAGDGQMLDEIIADLPARIVRHLRDVMRVPPALDQQSAVDFVRQRVAQRLAVQDRKSLARTVKAIGSRTRGVIGPMASYDALRNDAVETLVIAPEYRFDAFVNCDDCGSVESRADKGSNCSGCGSHRLRDWSVGAELVRLATQRGVPIIMASPAEVGDIGGVGCLLRDPVEIDVMPLPADQHAALDLVA